VAAHPPSRGSGAQPRRGLRGRTPLTGSRKNGPASGPVADSASPPRARRAPRHGRSVAAHPPSRGSGAQPRRGLRGRAPLTGSGMLGPASWPVAGSASVARPFAVCRARHVATPTPSRRRPDQLPAPGARSAGCHGSLVPRGFVAPSGGRAGGRGDGSAASPARSGSRTSCPRRTGRSIRTTGCRGAPPPLAPRQGLRPWTRDAHGRAGAGGGGGLRATAARESCQRPRRGSR